MFKSCVDTKHAVMAFLSTLICLASSMAGASDASVLQGRASVIDGDTIEIHGERIRLHGIDAPESGQICLDAKGQKWRCGQKSALALDDRIGRNPVTCRINGSDRYGRHIGVCTSGDTELNAWMVRQGWAVAYRKYSQDYVSKEQEAERANRGVWQGTFVSPEKWRNGERLKGSTVARTGSNQCAIKGNINSKGKRIYHLPGMKWYDRTRIDTNKGERWFCSEIEARDAGWQRAKK